MKNFIILFLFFTRPIFCQQDKASLINLKDCIEEIGNLRTSTQIAPGFAKSYFAPYVVNPGENFSMVIQLDNNTIKQLEITCPNFATIRYKNSAVTTLILKDDGTQGDAVANDNVFTLDQLTYPSTSILPEGWFMRICEIGFVGKNGLVEQQNIDLAFGIRVIPNNTALPVLKKINDSVQYSEYVLNIVTKEDRKYDRSGLAKDYYKFLPDDRDFLIKATTYPTPGSFPAGDFTGVRGSIKGIRVNNPDIDNSVNYGSSKKLLGWTNLYYTHGGLPFLINHELLHYWANFLDPALKLSDGTSHWGVTLFPSSGFGSGLQTPSFTKLSDTTYQAGQLKNNQYNNLELYLMGLLPIDSVAFPIQTLKDYRSIGFNGVGIVYYSTGIMEITKDLFFKNMILRSPGVATSQKLFKVGTMVVSDRLLTAKEMAYYHSLMKENENQSQSPATLAAGFMNFSSATRGKAHLETRLVNNFTAVVSHEKKQEIMIYPNPIQNGKLYISIEKERPDSYLLSDLKGSILVKGRIVNNSIDLSSRILSMGMYLLQIKTKEGKNYTEKIIIQSH